MSASKKSKVYAASETVEVLYQRMGDRWFAFSLIGDDVFFGSVPAQDDQVVAKATDLGDLGEAMVVPADATYETSSKHHAKRGHSA